MYGNHSCNENVIMRSSCVVELHVHCQQIKILGVAQKKTVVAKFMLPVTVNLPSVFTDIFVRF